MVQKLTTCFWFNGGVDEAVECYLRVFPGSTVTSQSRYPENAPGVAGSTLVANIELLGQEIMLLNGGPHYTLSPAASLVISCDDQAEVDHYWDNLLDGGEAAQCGWLTDRFGVSWQIVPKRLGELMSDPDPEKSGRTMQAMLGMVKLDIAALEAAHRGE